MLLDVLLRLDIQIDTHLANPESKKEGREKQSKNNKIETTYQ